MICKVSKLFIGVGKPLFVDIKQRQEFKLVDARRFSLGVVQLCYHPAEKFSRKSLNISNYITTQREYIPRIGYLSLT